jgi:hypothetical protein
MYMILISSENAPTFEEMLKIQIEYPEFARKMHEEGIVLVSFTFDEEGKIHITEKNTDNPMLCDYVVSKLYCMELSPYPVPNKEYNMKFVFKLL